jgi:23S rRNA (adenine1618-N6)-methyltransferase
VKKIPHKKTTEKKPVAEEKTNLHPRNPHRFRYDFPALISSCKELEKFVGKNEYGNDSVNFADPEAVKTLNKAILKHFYHISYWDIPAGYLCPPIPGRADYIHYIADLLSVSGQVPTGQQVRGLDIGTGANCIYPILGSQSYGWSFVGAEADQKAFRNAETIVASNTQLVSLIECRLQRSASQIFNGIIQPDDRFDFSMCNPPFHASMAAASAGTQRKWNNLKRGKTPGGVSLNFGGQQAELSYPGGEQSFILKMIGESAEYGGQCGWFTSLVSKKETLPAAYKKLKTLDVSDVKTISMSQGQKVSRMLAWTFR